MSGTSWVETSAKRWNWTSW